MSQSLALHEMKATINVLNRLDEGERLLVLSEIEGQVNKHRIEQNSTHFIDMVQYFLGQSKLAAAMK